MRKPPFVPDETSVPSLLKSITEDSWENFYQYQQYRENIEDGNPEYNSGGYPENPTRFSPSQSVQCPRKHYYRQADAPEETSPPNGLFWMGTEIEEQLITPWLRSIAEKNGYFVQNDLYLETVVETDAGELRFAGLTDPTICRKNGTPVCITEIKSKKSLTKLDGPKERDSAQATVYQKAAAVEYDIDPPPVKLIYIGRTRLDARVFDLDYDPQRWARVVKWADQYSSTRQAGELPPADPEESWECKLCQYRGRCGRGDHPFSDQPADGLLPFFEYPRDSLIDYLAANEDARLTPTCAHLYPELAEEYGVLPFICPRCEVQYEWIEVLDEPNDSTVFNPPYCPSCIGEDQLIEMWPPDPDDQF